MPTPRLFLASSFRIAVLYLALFALTLLVLSGVVYWSTVRLIDRQLNETVEAEIRGLGEEYRDEGLDRLIEVIGERSGTSGDRASVYLLADSELKPIAGNLGSWPERVGGKPGWLEVPLERAGEQPLAPHVVRGVTLDLPDGYHLFVGRAAEERGHFQRIMLETLTWALGPALLLGLLGGVLIGRYSLRRVDAVRQTSQDIIKGDLARRVPLTGSGDEFDRLGETINEMLDRIDMLMTGMRAVTDSLAHDLRSPLTRARGAIDTALREGSSRGYRLALEQTAEELETILRTFEALIRIARAEAGLDRLSLATLDLSALLSDLFEVYLPIAEDAGLELTQEIVAPVRIEGHRELLGQAVANLLENALKYAPPGGRVVLGLEQARDLAVIAVRDNGPGIDPGDRERVLQRFVRLDSSRGTPGSGLGLSLVAAVAKLHRGRLRLADADPGLLVEIAVPVSEAKAVPGPDKAALPDAA